MTLNDFLEKFLPDYEAKYHRAIIEAPNLYDDEQKELWAFYDIFPEALKNFADKICEKQRDNCEWDYQHTEHIFDNFIRQDIKQATQPKIEEL
jgi:hypothetical protein